MITTDYFLKRKAKKKKRVKQNLMLWLTHEYLKLLVYLPNFLGYHSHALDFYHEKRKRINC